MKKFLLLISLICSPFLLSAQVAEEPIMAASNDSVEVVEEFQEDTNLTTFMDEMIRPHIEDTIKPEDLPMFIVSSEGDTVGILLTVEMVQNLDKKADLAEAMDKALFECDKLDEFYIQVIDDLEGKITVLEAKVQNLKDQETQRTALIANLQSAIQNKEEQLNISNDIQMLDEEIISSLESDLKKEKAKGIGLITGGSVLGAIVLGLSIFIGTR